MQQFLKCVQQCADSANDGPLLHGIRRRFVNSNVSDCRPVADHAEVKRTRLGYVTTHYPAVSHTFIQREVLGLRSRGFDVSTFSLNHVDADALLTPIDREESGRTVEIKALPKVELAVTIVRQVIHSPKAAARTLLQALSGHGADPASWFKRSMQFAEGLVLHAECASRGVDHVHAHFGQAPANVAWYATSFGSRAGCGPTTFSFTIHGPQDCLDEPTPALRRKVEAAAGVVAVSDYTAAQLLRRIPQDSWGSVAVIRCGFERGEVVSSRSDEQAPMGREPVVVVVGRLSPEKGHAIVIEALALLLSHGIPARLRLVGPGDYDSTLAPLAERFAVDDRIEHVGPLPPAEVLAEMVDADVLALPSFAEGLPVVLMEAMAQGCPVVASQISGIPELVQDGVTGLLVPPARADLLAVALERLLTDPDLADRLAREARTRVHDLHDGHRQIDRLAEWFETIDQRERCFTTGESS